MTPEEQALFDQWLELNATEEEKALPYIQQVEAHICWLASGLDTVELANILPEELDGPH